MVVLAGFDGDDVAVFGDEVEASVGGGPQESGGCEGFDGEAFGVPELVVAGAFAAGVAAVGRALLGVFEAVVDVAADGGAAAAGEPAGPVAGFDEGGFFGDGPSAGVAVVEQVAAVVGG